MFIPTRIGTHNSGPSISWAELTTGARVFFIGCGITLIIMGAVLCFVILDLIFDGKLADSLGRWWAPKRDRILEKLGIQN